MSARTPTSPPVIESKHAPVLRDRSALDLPPCCPTHRPDNERMGYVAQSEDAHRRMALGQKQRRCPVCKLWFWKHEFGPGWVCGEPS